MADPRFDVPKSFPPGTKFGLVDGKPWSYVEAGTGRPSDTGAFDFSTGTPVRASMSVFRDDAELVSEADFRRAIAASHAGK